MDFIQFKQEEHTYRTTCMLTPFKKQTPPPPPPPQKKPNKLGPSNYNRLSYMHYSVTYPCSYNIE